MINIKAPKMSLKLKLLFFIMLIAFVPIFLLGQYSDRLTQNMIRNDTIKVESLNLTHKMIFIEDQVQQVEKFADWLSMDSRIIALMKRSPEEQMLMDELKQTAISELNEQFVYNGITSNVLSLFILGYNGLDIRNGIEAALVEPSTFYKERWFQEYQIEQRVVFWGNLTPNFNQISSENHVIPFVRTINNLDTGERLGNMVILLKEDFFSNVYQDIGTNDSERMYITDEKGNVISSNETNLLDVNMIKSKVWRIISSKIREGKTQNYFEFNNGTLDHLVVYNQSKTTGWIYIHILPQMRLQDQNRIISNKLMTSVGILLLAIVVMSFLVSRTLTHPIERLVEQIEDISKGHFKKKIEWHGHNELGQLGSSVNRMSAAIDNLLTKQVQEERQKYILEMHMLQSQINPHFLYNTLNSIKTMAVLQGSYGIEKMVSNLGSLLKASLGSVDETITIREELEILEKYIHIQKIRYMGKVKFTKRIMDENLLSCQMIRFILQPIVENAIFHGIQAREGNGDIILTVSRNKEHFQICIWDNGVGMCPEDIRKIHKDDAQSILHHKNHHGIGMNNIQRRIKLIYGDQYGLEIESRIGEFTLVTIRLPIIYKEIDEVLIDCGEEMGS